MLRKPIDSITQFAGITTLSIGKMYCSPAISRSKLPHVGVYLFGAVYKKEKKVSKGKALAAAVDRSAIARGSTHNPAPYRAERRPAQAALRAARCGADCVRNNVSKNVRLAFSARPDTFPVSGTGDYAAHDLNPVMRGNRRTYEAARILQRKLGYANVDLRWSNDQGIGKRNMAQGLSDSNKPHNTRIERINRMPFYIENERKAYTFKLSPANLPIVQVMTLGGVPYVACCALCGCIHELRHGAIDGGEFEPRCLLKSLHPAAYQAWIAKQPQAADYTRVTLKYRNPHIIPLADAPGMVEKAA